MKGNYLSALLKFLKMKTLSKPKIPGMNENLNPNLNITQSETDNIRSSPEYSNQLSDTHFENDASQEQGSPASPQVSDDMRNIEKDHHHENRKNTRIIIENIPDFNDDGIIDIRDVILAVIQEIKKYDDFFGE